MKRRHLIELHEQAWFPAEWRRLFQDGLACFLVKNGFHRKAAVVFGRLLARLRATSVLDLCTGASGPVLQLVREAAASEANPELPKVFLSDLYPNHRRFRQLRAANPELIDYVPTPVDARAVPDDARLPRVRTILTALHHFRPDEAREILRDAALKSDGVAVLECTGRRWQDMVLALLAPFGAAIAIGFLLRACLKSR